MTIFLFLLSFLVYFFIFNNQFFDLGEKILIRIKIQHFKISLTIFFSYTIIAVNGGGYMDYNLKGYETKTEISKKEKKQKLLESAYQLFTTKGIHNTSIQDIVDKAGVAKGTFYLYFQDKYSLQKELIIKKSKELFQNALNHLDKNINNFDSQFIFIINYIIDEMKQKKDLVKFIAKDLSNGFYSDKFSTLIDEKEIGIYHTFEEALKKHHIQLKNPNVTLYMIIELVGSTCFSSILYEKPLPIEEYKPYLYQTIQLILNEETKSN